MQLQESASKETIAANLGVSVYRNGKDHLAAAKQQALVDEVHVLDVSQANEE